MHIIRFELLEHPNHVVSSPCGAEVIHRGQTGDRLTRLPQGELAWGRERFVPGRVQGPLFEDLEGHFEEVLDVLVDGVDEPVLAFEELLLGHHFHFWFC